MRSVMILLVSWILCIGMRGISDAALINFDDAVAPSTFSAQVPLAEQYSALGVHFSGTGEVLDQSGGFGVDLTPPFSPRNFLAFNNLASAFPPETMSFDFRVGSVSLDFAGQIGTIRLTGYSDGGLVNEVSMYSASDNDWSPLTLSGGQFDTVIFNIDAQSGAFVIDNLRFEAAAVPEPTTLAIWGTMSGLGLIAARRRKRGA